MSRELFPKKDSPFHSPSVRLRLILLTILCVNDSSKRKNVCRTTYKRSVLMSSSKELNCCLLLFDVSLSRSVLPCLVSRRTRDLMMMMASAFVKETKGRNGLSPYGHLSFALSLHEHFHSYKHRRDQTPFQRKKRFFFLR